MKKKIGILILILFAVVACKKPELIYEGRLSEVIGYENGAWGNEAVWIVKFEDGRTMRIPDTPDFGWKVGETYEVYRTFWAIEVEEVKQ